MDRKTILATPNPIQRHARYKKLRDALHQPLPRALSIDFDDLPDRIIQPGVLVDYGTFLLSVDTFGRAAAIAPASASSELKGKVLMNPQPAAGTEPSNDVNLYWREAYDVLTVDADLRKLGPGEEAVLSTWDPFGNWNQRVALKRGDGDFVRVRFEHPLFATQSFTWTGAELELDNFELSIRDDAHG